MGILKISLTALVPMKQVDSYNQNDDCLATLTVGDASGTISSSGIGGISENMILL